MALPPALPPPPPRRSLTPLPSAGHSPPPAERGTHITARRARQGRAARPRGTRHARPPGRQRGARQRPPAPQRPAHPAPGRSQPPRPAPASRAPRRPIPCPHFLPGCPPAEQLGCRGNRPRARLGLLAAAGRPRRAPAAARRLTQTASCPPAFPPQLRASRSVEERGPSLTRLLRGLAQPPARSREGPSRTAVSRSPAVPLRPGRPHGCSAAGRPYFHTSECPSPPGAMY